MVAATPWILSISAQSRSSPSKPVHDAEGAVPADDVDPGVGEEFGRAEVGVDIELVESGIIE